MTNIVVEVMPQFEGYVYPERGHAAAALERADRALPYITGLVAGAFIMASLVRVFNVRRWSRSTGCRC